jgi:hypothetical protein
MNNELVIDNVDKMYSKLGPFQPSKAKQSTSLTHQPYIILEGGAYTGYTKENNPEGMGCLLLNTGQIYEGHFKNGQIQGIGRMIDLDGTAYEGYWKRNDLKGEGKIIWLDGKTYEGKIRKIKPHGIGILHFEDSSYYTGRFVRGSMHGNGVIVWANGRIYAGEWRKNDMNGFGAMHWADKYFFGSFKNGEISGIGKMQWNDGKAYLGEWTKGFRHGAGCMVEDSKFKQGLWETDKFILEENLKTSRLDKITEILEEKVKELKSDEILEKFIEFTGIFTKGFESDSCAMLSELNESEMQMVQDQDDNESIFSTPQKNQLLEKNEEIDSETEIIEVNTPLLERYQSESVQSELLRFHQPMLHLNEFASDHDEQISLPGDIQGPEDFKTPEDLSQDNEKSFEAPVETERSKAHDPEPLLLTREIEDAQFERSEAASEYSQPFKVPEPYLTKESFSDRSFGLQSFSESESKALSIHQPSLIKTSESHLDSSGTSYSSELKERVFRKPFMEVPDLSQSQSFRDSEESLPKLQLIKEFTFEPSISTAPVLIHAPQVFAPDVDLTLNISLEKIEEVNESLQNLDLDQSISTVFEEQSEFEVELKEFELPENVDINNFIRTKEKNDKEKKENENENELFDGRLEKILVVQNEKAKVTLMKTTIHQNRPEGSLDFFSSPKRDLLIVSEYKTMDYSLVPGFLQDMSLPLSDGFELLTEMRELLAPFDYSNIDMDPFRDGLVLVEWVKDSELIYCGMVDFDGNREGLGIEVTPAGVYEGYWRKNMRHGLGRFISIEGDNFEGFWRNDYKRGFGALWKYIGEGFVGDWEFDVPQGLGTEISSLEIYEGSFHHGLRHGQGVLVQSNLKYTGEFFKGSLHGYGVIQWNNGNTYAGIFIHGESKGMKGAFIPAYKKNVYIRRKIRKNYNEVLENETKDYQEESESSDAQENSDDEGKRVRIDDKISFDYSRDSKGSKGSKDSKDSKASKISKDSKISKSSQNSKVSQTLKNSQISHHLNSSENYLKPNDSKGKSQNSSIISASPAKPPLSKLVLVQPEENEIQKGSMSHSENQNLNESRVSENKIQFPEATKGILKQDPTPRDEKSLEIHPKLNFHQNIQDYSDEVLQNRKMKFKLANKEKGVESILKKDKKKS